MGGGFLRGLVCSHLLVSFFLPCSWSQLQSGEIAAPHPSNARAPDPRLYAFAGTTEFKQLSGENDYTKWHQACLNFCDTLDGGCTWEMYFDLLGAIREKYSNYYDPDRLNQRVPLSNFDYKPTMDEGCQRIQPPTSEEFFNEYVLKNQPVIIENAANDWPAMKSWNASHFARYYGREYVAVSVSPDGDFDKAEPAEWWGINPEDLKATRGKNWGPQDEDLAEFVLTRPAHINVTFLEFLHLMASPYGKEASFYLEYFPVAAMRSEFIRELGTLKFAEFLQSQHHLVWIGGNTNGKLHFDRHENLMTMVRGSKEFRLYDPSQTTFLYGGTGMASATLSYGWDPNGTAVFQRDPGMVTAIADPSTGAFNTMSPVDLENIDLKRFPRAKHAKQIRCRIHPGDTLYLPSHWWHEVLTDPEKDGVGIGANNFFHPLYNRYDPRHPFFEKNRHYQPLFTGEIPPTAPQRRRGGRISPS